MTGDLSALMPAMAVPHDTSARSARAPALTPEEAQEARWIVRARIGDEDAVSWLLARYRTRAIRLATQVLHRPDEAEDAAQEAFIRAFRAIRSFRGEGRFSTWLFHIVIRVCLDRRRLKRWDAEIPFDESMPLSSPPDRADTRMLVRELLDRLSPPIRAALILREMEGLEYEEIAHVLDIPVGTVRSRLNAARTRFRDMWEKISRETNDVG